MSSQNYKRVRCQCVTKKGKKCRRNATQGEILCFQHQEKKEPLTSIVHIMPSFQLVPVTFNDTIVSDSTCKYKNKYGEYACKEEKKRCDFCDEHYVVFNSLYSKLLHLVKKCRSMTESVNTLDAMMNIFYHVFNCMNVHKEMLVNFSYAKPIKRLNFTMMNKLSEFLEDFITNKPLTNSNLRRFKNSLSMEYHINKLLQLQTISNELLIDVQITKARNSLIANNIKIHKLSEIHIKNKSDDTQPCAIICKGINDKILSFIV